VSARLERSTMLRNCVDDGSIRIVGIVFRLTSGDIEFHVTEG